MSGLGPTSSSTNGLPSPGARSGAPVTATPGSYMYTSSSGLLRGGAVGDKPLARAVPPPTLPKYTSSGSFRLASLDRLAHRQRLFECNGSVPGSAAAAAAAATGAGAAGSPSAPQQNGSADSGASSAASTPSPAQQPPPPTQASNSSPPQVNPALQSKRELFFKNELPSGGGGAAQTQSPAVSAVTTYTTAGTVSTVGGVGGGGGGGGGGAGLTSAPTPSSIKEALAAKRAASERSAAAAAAAAALAAAAADGHATEDNKDRYSKVERDKVPERRTKELDGYVGFASLPNQVYRKAVKKGFDFTLMVVGESGLGKSTLINSMFLADIYSNEYPGPSQRTKKTVQVETSKVLLKENGVNLTLTVVDTPGFGDAVDNSNCWQPIIDYIETKYEEYLNAESRVNRKTLSDSRVHCCLYFIGPSGHGLKPLDVEFMQRLHDKVNIIPVIAKSDTMTPDECAHFKKQILNEISQHKIKIYEFPDTQDEEESKANKALKDRVPFAVVGSNTVIEVDGKKVRGRKYPWGIAEVENLEHCDFLALRNMLIRTHLQDLKDVTNHVHYENFRCRKLAGLGTDGKPTRVSNNLCTQGVLNSFMTVWNPLAQMEEEKRDHEAKMKKMETEMEQVFEMKVREKKQKLKDSETDLQRRHEQMRKALEQQIKDMEDRRNEFERERIMWEQANGVTLEDLRRRSLEANSKETVDGKEKSKKKKGLF